MAGSSPTEPQTKPLLMRRCLGSPAAAAGAPPPEPSNHITAAGDTNFDTNMVIILAALLCALICALGLNSIVRCALRCGRRIAFDTRDEAAARMSSTGLKKRALRRIPVAVYGASGGTIPATECPICLGEFAGGEKVRVLPRCNHGFHVLCIDTWLASHSSCPICRHSLLDWSPTAASRAAAVEETGGQTASMEAAMELELARFLFCYKVMVMGWCVGPKHGPCDGPGRPPL